MRPTKVELNKNNTTVGWRYRLTGRQPKYAIGLVWQDNSFKPILRNQSSQFARETSKGCNIAL
jgi:hypothetical protein